MEIFSYVLQGRKSTALPGRETENVVGKKWFNTPIEKVRTMECIMHA